MSPGRYPGSLARRAPTQRHIHTKAVGSAGKVCPRPLALRTGLLLRAVVQFQPLPEFTTSGMRMATKGSMRVGLLWNDPVEARGAVTGREIDDLLLANHSHRKIGPEIGRASC